MNDNILKENRRLDSLARILEGADTCAVVMPVEYNNEQKLLIANNTGREDHVHKVMSLLKQYYIVKDKGEQQSLEKRLREVVDDGLSGCTLNYFVTNSVEMDIDNANGLRQRIESSLSDVKEQLKDYRKMLDAHDNESSDKSSDENSDEESLEDKAQKVLGNLEQESWKEELRKSFRNDYSISQYSDIDLALDEKWDKWEADPATVNQVEFYRQGMDCLKQQLKLQCNKLEGQCNELEKGRDELNKRQANVEAEVKSYIPQHKLSGESNLQHKKNKDVVELGNTQSVDAIRSNITTLQISVEKVNKYLRNIQATLTTWKPIAERRRKRARKDVAKLLKMKNSDPLAKILAGGKFEFVNEGEQGHGDMILLQKAYEKTNHFQWLTSDVKKNTYMGDAKLCCEKCFTTIEAVNRQIDKQRGIVSQISEQLKWKQTGHEAILVRGVYFEGAKYWKKPSLYQNWEQFLNSKEQEVISNRSQNIAGLNTTVMPDDSSSEVDELGNEQQDALKQPQQQVQQLQSQQLKQQFGNQIQPEQEQVLLQSAQMQQQNQMQMQQPDVQMVLQTLSKIGEQREIYTQQLNLYTDGEKSEKESTLKSLALLNDEENKLFFKQNLQTLRSLAAISTGDRLFTLNKIIVGFEGKGQDKQKDGQNLRRYGKWQGEAWMLEELWAANAGKEAVLEEMRKRAENGVEQQGRNTRGSMGPHTDNESNAKEGAMHGPLDHMSSAGKKRNLLGHWSNSKMEHVQNEEVMHSFIKHDSHYEKSGKVGQMELVGEVHDEHGASVRALVERMEKMSEEDGKRSVVALERKEGGENLGMRDVRLLAEVMKYNEGCKEEERIALPAGIEETALLWDAKLVNEAQKHGVQVVGVEGKGLAHGQQSLEYNADREDYMARQLTKLKQQGYNVVMPVGEAHVKGLQSRLVVNTAVDVMGTMQQNNQQNSQSKEHDISQLSVNAAMEARQQSNKQDSQSSGQSTSHAT